MNRGPENERIDSQCDKCGGYYCDCGLSQAQAMHDRNEPCDGKLHPVVETLNKECKV